MSFQFTAAGCCPWMCNMGMLKSSTCLPRARWVSGGMSCLTVLVLCQTFPKAFLWLDSFFQCGDQASEDELGHPLGSLGSC